VPVVPEVRSRTAACADVATLADPQPSPQRCGISGLRYAFACRLAPDQSDSAVLSMSARDSAGSSEASKSI